MKQLLSVLFCLVFFATPGFGWGTKEHVQLTRIAASRLMNDPSTPPEMKSWLQSLYPQAMDMAAERDFFMTARLGAEPKGLTGISHFVIEPDLIANDRDNSSKVAPFGVLEKFMHYIDLEFFIGGDAPRVYKHDLSNKPKLEDFPRDPSDIRYVQAGFLPFRIEQCYQELVKSIREKRLAETPDGNHAVKWAGYVAHYLQDNTQPHHATIDYKSATYFGGRRNAPNVHSEMEWKMGDDAQNDFRELRTEFWPKLEQAIEKMQDPVQTDDLFVATLQVSMQSYDALPLIGQAAVSAAGGGKFSTEAFFRFTGEYRGREVNMMDMKAEQLAWAVRRVERVWKKAWEEGSK